MNLLLDPKDDELLTMLLWAWCTKDRFSLGDCLQKEIWDTRAEEMIALSKQYPKTLFTLFDLRASHVRVEYYKNCKSYTDILEFTFREERLQ